MGWREVAMLYLNLLRCCLLIVLLLKPAFAAQQVQPESFRPIASSQLKPVYGPLAEQIVADFNLVDKPGIGIDLGSGPGDLIIELCKRTRQLHWINADINPRFFPGFMQMAHQAGFDSRVSAIYADAQNLPFHDNYAAVIVSRGSFHLWQDLNKAFAEIYRVLGPGGVAFIGRGFSENLPIEIAGKIRSQQRKRGFDLSYDVNKTAEWFKAIMERLSVKDYRIRIPQPSGNKEIKYGIWLEFHKPE
jgi:SAM-dependent methyltransferase